MKYLEHNQNDKNLIPFITSFQNYLSSAKEEEFISQNLDYYILHHADELSKLPISILYRILTIYFKQYQNSSNSVTENTLTNFFFQCLDSHEGDNKRAVLLSLFPFKDSSLEVYKTIIEKYSDVAQSNYMINFKNNVIDSIIKDEEQIKVSKGVFIILIFVLPVVMYMSFRYFYNQKEKDYKLKNLQRINDISTGYQNQIRELNLQLDNHLHDSIKSSQQKTEELNKEINDIIKTINQASFEHQNDINSLADRIQEITKLLQNQIELIKIEGYYNISLIKSALNHMNEAIFTNISYFASKENKDIENVTKLISNLQEEHLTDFSLLESALHNLNESVVSKIESIGQEVVTTQLINERLHYQLNQLEKSFKFSRIIFGMTSSIVAFLVLAIFCRIC